jgi:hypothetical protein
VDLERGGQNPLVLLVTTSGFVTFRRLLCQEVDLAADIIRNGTFSDGFEVGYRSIRGTATGMPGIPGQPGTRGNMTPFLMGVRKGIERGLGKDIDELGS